MNKKNIYNKLKDFSPFIIMGLIFTLSSISQKNLPTVDITHIDKIEHFIAYFVLSYAWYLALKNRSTSIYKTLVLSVLFTAIYGVFDEFHQELFSEGRVWDIYDIAADVTGSLSASIFVLFTKKK